MHGPHPRREFTLACLLPSEQRKLHLDGMQPLPDVVVEVGGDMPALVLLGGDQSARELAQARLAPLERRPFGP